MLRLRQHRERRAFLRHRRRPHRGPVDGRQAIDEAVVREDDDAMQHDRADDLAAHRRGVETRASPQRIPGGHVRTDDLDERRIGRVAGQVDDGAIVR